MLKRIHRWVGLACAAFLIVTALSGAILLLTSPWDEASNAHLFRVATPPDAAGSILPSSAALSAIESQLESRYSDVDWVLKIPQSPGQSLKVYLRGANERQAFFDPYTGAFLGERANRDSLHEWVFSLHTELLLGEPSGPLLAVIGLFAFALVLSGLWLFLRGVGRLRWRLRRVNPRIFWFDVHRLAGVYLALFAAFFLLTGAYLSWRPISMALTSMSGQSLLTPPIVPAPNQPPVIRSERAPLAVLIQQAQQQAPSGQIVFVQIARDATRAIRIRKRLADELHPNGLTSFWLDPYQARVLRVDPWHRLDIGARLFQWIYPLHSGHGLHWTYQALLVIAALALLLMSLSGLWLWWQRRPGTR